MDLIENGGARRGGNLKNAGHEKSSRRIISRA